MNKLKGNQDFDLPFGHHAINCQTPFPILVSLDDVPQRVLQAGSNKVVVKGEGKLSLNPTDKSEYGVSITSRKTQKGEKFDDKPIPEPAPADNYLQMLKQQVRQQMGITRENFANQLTIYETGDYTVFEEDRTPTPQKDPKPSPEAAQAVSEPIDEPTTEE